MAGFSAMTDHGHAVGWRGLACWLAGTAAAWFAAFVLEVDFVQALESKWASVLKLSAVAGALLLVSLVLLRAARRALGELSDAGRTVAAILAATAMVPGALTTFYTPIAIIARLNHNPHGPLGQSGLTGPFWPVLGALVASNLTVAISAAWLLLRLRAQRTAMNA